MATRDKKWRIQWGLIAEAQILDDTSQPMYMNSFAVCMSYSGMNRVWEIMSEL